MTETTITAFRQDKKSGIYFYARTVIPPEYIKKLDIKLPEYNLLSKETVHPPKEKISWDIDNYPSKTGILKGKLWRIEKDD